MRLARGVAVEHPTFGTGVIVSSDPRYTQIRFSDESRKFVTPVLLTLVGPPKAPKPRPPADPPPPRPAAVCRPVTIPKRTAAPKPAPRSRRKTPVYSAHCNQCGKDWHPRTPDPKTCRSCSSPFWNEPKRDLTVSRKRAGDARRKYRATPEIDAVIAAAYEELRKSNNRSALRSAAVKIGWPKHAVRCRAIELGLSRAKEPDWSAEEIAFLQENLHLTPMVISRKLRARGFERSATGVNLKIKRLQLRSDRDWYSAFKLAQAFGIDGHAVERWIDSGWLKAERRNTARTEKQGADSWLIWHEDVRAFVFAHPEEVDLVKVEKWWFLDLITEGRIHR